MWTHFLENFKSFGGHSGSQGALKGGMSRHADGRVKYQGFVWEHLKLMLVANRCPKPLQIWFGESLWLKFEILKKLTLCGQNLTPIRPPGENFKSDFKYTKFRFRRKFFERKHFFWPPWPPLRKFFLKFFFTGVKLRSQLGFRRKLQVDIYENGFLTD